MARERMMRVEPCLSGKQCDLEIVQNVGVFETKLEDYEGQKYHDIFAQPCSFWCSRLCLLSQINLGPTACSLWPTRPEILEKDCYIHWTRSAPSWYSLNRECSFRAPTWMGYLITGRQFVLVVNRQWCVYADFHSRDKRFETFQLWWNSYRTGFLPVAFFPLSIRWPNTFRETCRYVRFGPFINFLLLLLIFSHSYRCPSHCYPHIPGVLLLDLKGCTISFSI